tara:strand:+ start:1629 stop:2045 length:417 start_codon:yes stop_codon:yes gene_type:complete
MTTKQILALEDVFEHHTFKELFEEYYYYVPDIYKELKKYNDKSHESKWVLEETQWSDDTFTMHIKNMEGSEHCNLFMSNFENVRKRIRRIQFVSYEQKSGDNIITKFKVERIQECRDKDIRFAKDNLIINYKKNENAI